MQYVFISLFVYFFLSSFTFAAWAERYGINVYILSIHNLKVIKHPMGHESLDIQAWASFEPFEEVARDKHMIPIGKGVLGVIGGAWDMKVGEKFIVPDSFGRKVLVPRQAMDEAFENEINVTISVADHDLFDYNWYPLMFSEVQCDVSQMKLLPEENGKHITFCPVRSGHVELDLMILQVPVDLSELLFVGKQHYNLKGKVQDYWKSVSNLIKGSANIDFLIEAYFKKHLNEVEKLSDDQILNTPITVTPGSLK